MHWPYTLDFDGGYMAAQWGAALLLTAALLFLRPPRASRTLLLAAAWLAAVATQVAPSLAELSFRPGTEFFRHVLLVSASLGTLAAVLALRPGVSLVALAGQVPLYWVSGFVKSSDGELAALHLAWIGLLVGLLGRSPRPCNTSDATPKTEGSYLAHDVLAFAGATLLAALVSVYVMHRRDGDADEWGYTFQAAVFAKGRAYSTAPRCEHYLESMYVFESSGRLFSQYTPGWPMFITPFVWMRAVWLSGPFSMGLMVLGMARLGRSAVRALGRDDAPPSARTIRAAGTWAVILSGLSTSVLTNGGSRFSHVYVLALYAWSLEALLQVVMPGLARRRQVLWGLVLGCAALHMVAARPADGAFMGIGIALLFLYALVRRRVGWQALAAASVAFGLWAAVMLVILRLQLGKWFTTGYSLNAVLHPWNVVKYSKPAPHEWKYGLPLATGSYCWWPASMPLGLAGLARLRGRARGLAFAMAASCLPYIAYCSYLDVGQRGVDWGYGPRYLMVLVVPMVVGGAVILAPLTSAARVRAFAGASALSRGGPLALAAVAVATAWIRIVPPEWATVAEHTWRHSALQRAIETAKLEHAIVLAADGTTGFSDLDLTTNYPIDLYPDQPVLIAIDRKSPTEARECLRSAFPDRKLYRASGFEEAHISPL